MPTIQQWLLEYGESHKNETNKTIHWICVPAIFFSLTGLLYGVKLPFSIGPVQLNVAIAGMVFIIFYYISLSSTLWIGMLVFVIICLVLCYILESSAPVPLWLLSIGVFVAAWIGQFYGHKKVKNRLF